MLLKTDIVLYESHKYCINAEYSKCKNFIEKSQEVIYDYFLCRWCFYLLASLFTAALKGIRKKSLFYFHPVAAIRKQSVECEIFHSFLRFLKKMRSQ